MGGFKVFIFSSGQAFAATHSALGLPAPGLDLATVFELPAHGRAARAESFYACPSGDGVACLLLLIQPANNGALKSAQFGKQTRGQSCPAAKKTSTGPHLWTDRGMAVRPNQNKPMFGFGIFSLLAGSLQAAIAAYALRLYRAFGTSRIGWSVFTAFILLALVQVTGAGFRMLDGTVDLISFLISLLLLVGMAHTEVLLTERLRLEHKERELRRELQLEEQEKLVLTKTNGELLEEIARREQHEQKLLEGDAHYHCLFTNNAQPMWIFDLRSFRFLAANNAALRLFGFSGDELLALTAKDIRPAEDARDFMRDSAQPHLEVLPRGIWRHCKKDRSLIDLEITTLDLVYSGIPARLVLASELTESRKAELRLREARKMGALI
jgi:PAS domain S-box-containing protein